VAKQKNAAARPSRGLTQSVFGVAVWFCRPGIGFFPQAIQAFPG
jgi:hypothetical protein